MIEIRPLSNHTLASDFVGVFKRLIKNQTFLTKTSPSRVLYLRPSQMPFCPTSFFINHASRGLYGLEDFGSAFYTRVGTVVHEVLQNFLSRSGQLLADYHCTHCKKWHRMSYVHECCDHPTQYHEVEIDYKGIHGHIDAIYKDKEGRLWIVDFKTTSVKGAPGKKKDPGATYREQIETYAVLVELQYGLKIAGYADAFILRDNPVTTDPVLWVRPLTDETRKRVKQRLSRYKKMHRAALDAASKSEVLALMDWGRCKGEYCPVCSKMDDKQVRRELLSAYNLGKNKGHVPIRGHAQRAQDKLDAEAKRRK
ncbi:hypothetical protein [Ralstonia phage phiRSL1]|uniref:PD-(D/E)XK endonuclease-like domain-containing protein n=1 Tax=Ralstonia phage phiRSL1 TaxID=1980924 RepID=B2ZY41_9CAUD|nr:CRISPR/Cas system associated [Ralstonia phage phiRSL1]BAG41617.1 hypothetical protein [Ralstonia phage phiRSL1]